jgi:hypothetical protein
MADFTAKSGHRRIAKADIWQPAQGASRYGIRV